MRRDKHVDKATFKQIFVDHWDAFKRAYPRYDTPHIDDVVQKMLACGDPEKMGFVQYRCTNCGQTRRIAFTCKSAFCLSCSKPYTERWVDFIGRRLLPGVTYRHFVLTVPDFLHLPFFRDPRLLATLMRTGHACLLDVFKTCTGEDLDIGCVIVLQTAGRPGTYNPHLHMLVTAGGINPQGGWTSVSYMPYEILHKKWQYYLLTMLRQNLSDPKIQTDVDKGWTNYPNGFVAYLQPGNVPPGGKGLAHYLAKYVVSPPISVRRIERYDGRTVSYWYRDHKTGHIEHATLPALRFIGRMVQHILPKGFQRIRYFGLHGNRRYARMRERIGAILPATAPPDPRGFRVLPRMRFADLFRSTFGKDPLLCPVCGQRMELELISHPDHGILRDHFSSPGGFVEYVQRESPRAGPGPGRALDRAERMVQVPLPFM